MRTMQARAVSVFMLLGLLSSAWANQAPTISITSPQNEYEDLIAPASMNITVSAGDSDGSISKVEYFEGSNLIGQSTQSPFSFTWSNINQGRYALSARATDNGGAATTSATVYVTINGATVNGFLDRRWYSSSNSSGYIPYRLFMPPNYQPTTKYPVVMFLHGIGEAGTNNTNQLGNNCNGAGVFVSAANQSAYPCIMICPQSASGWWGGEPNAIIKKVQAKYNADIDRLYITGLSAGGISTWGQIIGEPALYAAAVPICGNGDTSRASTLTGIPIWDFHAADDGTVGVGGSDSMISAIRAAGGNPIYTRYANGGHGSWGPAYSNPLLVPWVMAQRRGVAPTNSPLLTISAPTNQQTYSTSAASINLSGTTIDAGTQITQIAWSNSLGGNGTASGTSNWSISGIPLTPGANLIQVTATGTSYNAAWGGSTTFNDTIKVTVAGTTPETPFNGTPFAIPGTVPVAQFNNGGEGVSYHDVDAINSGGQYRTTGVDIELCSEGGYDVGWTSAGEWLDYAVNVAASGNYDVQARVATPIGGTTFHISFGGVSIGTFSPPNTGDWQGWQTVTLSNVHLNAGQQTMQLVQDSGNINFAYIKVVAVTPPNTPPTISQVSNKTIAMNGNTGALAFTVNDAETAAGSLSVSGSSSNTTLVPNANIVFGGSGSSRTVTVTPAANQQGTATITLSVSDGTASASSTFVLTVNAPAPESPYNATAFAIPGTIPAAEFDNGGEGVAYHDIDAGNSGGQFRSTDVDIEICADGGYDVGWTYAGEWMKYMVNVASTGSYDIQARVASPNNSVSFHLNFGSTNVGTIAIPNTGGWQSWQTVTLGSVNLNAGAQVMQLVSDTGGFNVAYIKIVSRNAPGVVAAIDCGGTTSFTAADGTIYSADTNTTGAVNNFVRPIANTTDDALYQSYRWLSPTLQYSIPVPNGTYAVTLKFADIFSTGPGQKSFDVSVNGGLVAKALDTYALVGPDTAYDITCAANVTNGILDLKFIQGAAGNPSIHAILVKTRANNAPVAAAMQVSAAPNTGTAIALQGSDANGDYLLYTILSQPAHGTLSGSGKNVIYTPAANYTGADSFTYNVSDGASASAAATVSITVSSPNRAPVISSGASASPNPAGVGQAVSFSVAASDPDGDALSYGWNFGDGSGGNGANVSHVFASTGTYNVAVVALDGHGNSASSSVTVTVLSTTAINSGGSAVGIFAADQGFSGGYTYTSTSPINVSGVTNPAPQAVYQSERFGNFTYTLSGLTPGSAYTVRLHFAEIWWDNAGQRVFNVAINGTQLLANFDIFAAAGGKFIAIARTFNATADASGQIAIVYTTITDNAKSSGIEIVSAGAAARGVAVAGVAEPALLTDDGAISSIDLGTVKVGRAFKIKLDAPQTSKTRLRWNMSDKKKLAPGVSARGGMVGGKPRAAGTYTFNLEIKGKTTSATNIYTLTVIP
jgi:hypothetical protein